jgi:hypothetical protein
LHHLRPAERAEGDLRRLRATRERRPQSEPKEELMPMKYSAKPSLGWLRPPAKTRCPWLVPAMFFALLVATMFVVAVLVAVVLAVLK